MHVATHSPLSRRLVAQHSTTLHKISPRPDRFPRLQTEYVSQINGISDSDRRTGVTFCYKRHFAFSNTPSCYVSRLRTSTNLELPEICSQLQCWQTTTHIALHLYRRTAPSQIPELSRVALPIRFLLTQQFPFEVSVSAVFARFRISRLAKSDFSTRRTPNFAKPQRNFKFRQLRLCDESRIQRRILR